MVTEHFPISDNIIEKFISKNDGWEKDNNSKGIILINLSMVRMQIPWVLPKILYAKGLEEKTGYRVVALTWNSNSTLTSFFESFGIEHLALNNLCRKNITGGIKAAVKTLGFLLFDGRGEGLKKMEHRGLKIGNNLYEDILRTSSLSTMKSCRSKIAAKKILHLLWAVYTIEKLNKKNPIKYAVTDDMAYHEGLFIKLFKKYNSKVHACSNLAQFEVLLHENGEVIRHNWVDIKEVADYIEKLTDEDVAWVDNYLEERFKGNNGREIDRQAFSGKRVLSKEELVEQFGIDPNKKTVVVMAHTFTDAVFNYGDYYFRDYYDWTEKTLQLAANNSNCNFVLKPHPTRSSYNESVDSIEMMFDKYKKENMFFLSDDISSESIKNIADVLITIGGNAGAEYACFGIPAIIVGKPYYRGQGYTIEPASYDEYVSLLRDIEEVKPLDEEQIEIAKKVFFFKNHPKNSKDKFKDEFADLLNDNYKNMISNMALSYFKSNDGTKDYNDKALEAVIDYMSNNDLKDTEYYKRAMDKV